MEKCMKCLEKKILKYIIVIKKSKHPKLYKTLFKNVFNEMEICKACFGDLLNENAEFLDEKDIIDEIPIQWMQDEYQNIEKVAIKSADSSTFTLLKDENFEKDLKNIELEISSAVEDNVHVPTFEIQDDNSSEDDPVFVAEVKSNNVNDATHIPTFEIDDDSVDACDYSAIVANKTNVNIIEIDEDSLEAISITQTPNFDIEYNSLGLYEESLCSAYRTEDDSTNNNEEMELLLDYERRCKEIEEISEQNKIIEDSVESTNLNVEMDLLLDYERRSKEIEESLEQNQMIEDSVDSSNINDEMDYERRCKEKEERLDQNIINEDSVDLGTEELENDSKDHKEESLDSNAVTFDEPDEYSYICSGCGQVSDIKWKIQEHVSLPDTSCFDCRIKERTLENVFVCEYCGLFYRSANDLQAHRATGIHSNLLYQCPECTELFPELILLNQHKEKHTFRRMKFNPLFLCNVGTCMEASRDWKSLSQHKTRSHIAEICPVCKEVFNDTSVFASHLKSCKNYKSQCHACGKNLSLLGRKSLLLHEGKCKNISYSFHCKECNASFRRKHHLSKHIKNHHTPFDCIKCGKIFRSRLAGVQHMKSSCFKKDKKNVE